METLQLDKITAINGDCMEYMKSLPDKAFDLAIVDPPYGIDGQKQSICKNPKHNRKAHTQKDWDNSIPKESYFKELFRPKVYAYKFSILFDVGNRHSTCRTFSIKKRTFYNYK